MFISMFTKWTIFIFWVPFFCLLCSSFVNIYIYFLKDFFYCLLHHFISTVFFFYFFLHFGSFTCCLFSCYLNLVSTQTNCVSFFCLLFCFSFCSKTKNTPHQIRASTDIFYLMFFVFSFFQQDVHVPMLHGTWIIRWLMNHLSIGRTVRRLTTCHIQILEDNIWMQD